VPAGRRFIAGRFLGAGAGGAAAYIAGIMGGRGGGAVMGPGELMEISGGGFGGGEIGAGLPGVKDDEARWGGSRLKPVMSGDGGRAAETACEKLAMFSHRGGNFRGEGAGWPAGPRAPKGFGPKLRPRGEVELLFGGGMGRAVRGRGGEGGGDGGGGWCWKVGTHNHPVLAAGGERDEMGETWRTPLPRLQPRQGAGLQTGQPTPPKGLAVKGAFFAFPRPAVFMISAADFFLGGTHT